MRLPIIEFPVVLLKVDMQALSDSEGTLKRVFAKVGRDP